MFQWKRFQFFDKEQHLGEDKKSVLKNFLPSCSTGGFGKLIFGDTQGGAHVLSRNFAPLCSWQAHDKETKFVHVVKDGTILVTVGADAGEDDGNLLIKFWRFTNTQGLGRGLQSLEAFEPPQMVRNIKIFNKQFVPVPITCISVMQDHSQIAVGLGNGAVMLFMGNLLRDRNVKRVLLLAGGPCISGLHFRPPSGGGAPTVASEDDVAGTAGAPDHAEGCLFVVTTGQIMSYMIKDPSRRLHTIDDTDGSELGCSCMDNQRNLVVARKEAVWFFSAQDQGVCFGFQGMKKMIGWIGNYLWVVTENPRDAKSDQLTIYDLRNKFIAFSAKFESILNMVSVWETLFVVTESNRVYQLSEKDLVTKMEMLFKRSLYATAISLAARSDCDKSFIVDIFQKYGDHLYNKGDYDEAIRQYEQTIKHVEPSYVIRKFLDAQRIHNLTRYLQALHEQGRANTDHTTLLLNCYTKLKDVGKLDEFVQSNSWRFDVETAIKVCRQANYFDHTLFLARKHQQHALYLEIQMDDVHNYEDALAYIRALPFEDAVKYTKLHGQKLVRELTDQVVDHLVELCVDYTPSTLPPSLGELERRTLGKQQEAGGSKKHRSILSQQIASAQQAPALPPRPRSGSTLDYEQKEQYPSGAVATPAIHQQQQQQQIQKKGIFGSISRGAQGLWKHRRGSRSESVSMLSETPRSRVAQQPATPRASGHSRQDSNIPSHPHSPSNASLSPQQSMSSLPSAPLHSLRNKSKAAAQEFIHFFLDHPLHLEYFLEQVRWEPLSNEIVFNTLLELYLRQDFHPEDLEQAKQAQSGGSEDESKSPLASPASVAAAAAVSAAGHPRHDKIMNLLKADEIRYDPSQALMLMQQYNFERGLLFLYDRLQLFSEIVQHHMDRYHYSRVIKACKKHGTEDSSLWINALTYFSSRPDPCEQEIIECLRHIEQRNLLAPFMCVQIVSKSGNKPLSVIQDYVVRTLQSEHDILASDQQDIRRYEQDTSDMRRKIQELRSEPLTFQGSKCAKCRGPLELPSVHFLCRHSFHQHCTLDSDRECALCNEEFRKVRDMKQSRQQSAFQQDRFEQKLKHSADGFATISEYFGRGVFDPHIDVPGGDSAAGGGSGLSGH